MRAGRLLRQRMQPDTPDAVAERIRHRASCEQAFTEMMAKFAPLTAENFRAATDWQNRRVVELDAQTPQQD